MPSNESLPRRVAVPFLIDVVFVSAPDQIRKVEESGDVDRVHHFETRALPWWLRLFFRATKFHDDRRDLWFCPMEPKTEPTYLRRRHYLASKAAMGYQPRDVERIAELLSSSAPDGRIAEEMVDIVNRRFFGRQVPATIVEDARWTLQKLGNMLSPASYQRARRSQRNIMDYCVGALPPEVHAVDVGHNIGEVVQATLPALKLVRDNLEVPVERLFTLHAPTPQVLRIAVRDSTVGGLLRAPARARRTVFLLKIGRAAAETGDLRFTFGTGGPERLCVFQDFFLDFMRDLQAALRAKS